MHIFIKLKINAIHPIFFKAFKSEIQVLMGKKIKIVNNYTSKIISYKYLYHFYTVFRSKLSASFTQTDEKDKVQTRGFNGNPQH